MTTICMDHTRQQTLQTQYTTNIILTTKLDDNLNELNT